MTKTITKDTIIGDILDMDIETAGFFFEIGNPLKYAVGICTFNLSPFLRRSEIIVLIISGITMKRKDYPIVVGHNNFFE